MRHEKVSRTARGISSLSATCSKQLYPSSQSNLMVALTCDFSSRLRGPPHKHHVENKHPNQLTHQIPICAHIPLAPSQLPLPHQSQDKAAALATCYFQAIPQSSFRFIRTTLHRATSTKQGITDFLHGQVVNVFIWLSMNFNDMSYTSTAPCVDAFKPIGSQTSKGQPKP